MPVLDVADVARKLQEANAGPLTMQSMIFEPATLVLHLAIGSLPSSAQPMQRLPLAELLKPTAASAAHGPADPSIICGRPLAVDALRRTSQPASTSR